MSMEYFATSSLSNADIKWIIIGLFILGLIATVSMPLILAVAHHGFKSKIQTSVGEEEITSFFQIPYATWYLIHWGISIIALLAIVALGIDGVLDKATIAALLGSLLGYTLGSTASHAAAAAQNQRNTGCNNQKQPQK